MELPIFYMPINIGLAKKFIWVFLWDGMEKPEWTFWSTRYKNPCHFPNLSLSGYRWDRGYWLVYLCFYAGPNVDY